MKRLYLNILLIYIFISILPISVKAAQGGAQTQLEAQIAHKVSFRIFGYTSPNSLVQVLGVRVFGQTNSDKTGYFMFQSVPISAEATELCLTTIDAERRSGFPLCIAVPDTTVDGEIGPLLLAPTLSLNRDVIWQNDKTMASGKTIPNQTVAISVFTVAPGTILAKLQEKIAGLINPQVFADDSPLIKLQSDTKGNFNFELPTDKTVGYRFFAKTYYEGMPTPKSQTLSFVVGALGKLFILYWLPWIVLILICSILIYLLARYEKKTSRVYNYLIYLNEKKLQPFVIRSSLRWKRTMYNLREQLRSYRR